MRAVSALSGHETVRQRIRSSSAIQGASGRSNSGEKPLPLTLREVRHARGLTVTEAAERAGLHKGRISELERGERSPRQDELDALCAAYGVRAWRVVLAIVVDEGGEA